MAVPVACVPISDDQLLGALRSLTKVVPLGDGQYRIAGTMVLDLNGPLCERKYGLPDAFSVEMPDLWSLDYRIYDDLDYRRRVMTNAIYASSKFVALDGGGLLQWSPW
jgi:hypothetical protein